MERLSRAKAIRAYCLECCNNFAPEVRRCHITRCTLWPYRMGSPSKAGVLPDEMADVEENTSDEVVGAECVE